ncbi:hypothetical protein CU669_10995 [Paramagnetospirillum kuznetsovii]|uniref:Glycosyltransferase subfamily 4-like N-terminal domain-containing protein n=1 Tax=Paramagnetospirillum kuznetsovii TaxID=2053833 RepID=A0A364NY42_9PROT|nr:hypothetical protein [Paramagnetospirillum kuznetsovii]RAU21825.1 hypothetical protein CU669_10995 [Paramagnetospirillum kuznetsovii]
MDAAMLNFIAISMWMPPTVTPRAIQVGRLLKHLRGQGWGAGIITHDPATYEPRQFLDFDFSNLHGDILAGMETVSLDPLPIHSRRALVKALLGGVREESHHQRWFQRGLEAALRLAARKEHVAFATFAGPWESHELGLELAAKTGLPWVAHFADPWVDNPYFVNLDPAEMIRRRNAEAAVAERADALVFVSDKTRDLVMSKYPTQWSERAYVVPHAFDRDLLEGLPEPPALNRMRIVHTGNFYAARSAEPLLDAVALIAKNHPGVARDLDIRLIGLIEEGMRYRIAQAGLDEIVTLIGQRPYRETLFEITCADLTLVIDADVANSVFLPSKLVDYIGLSKPVLGITPADSATADLLARLDCPILPVGNARNLAEAMIEAHARWTHGRLDVGSTYRRVAAEFDAPQVAHRFALVLKQAITTRQAR